MRYTLFPFISLSLFFLSACAQNTSNSSQKEKTPTTEVTSQTTVSDENAYIFPEGKDIQSRFQVPEGFERVAVSKNSFGEWLRKVQLKPHGTKARLFNGELKTPENVYAAVLGFDVGTKDLQQCADAVMRLRAEYFYALGQYNKVHFNFTNGTKAEFNKYAEGYRAVVNGNKVSWVKNAKADNSYASFRKYMDLVFNYSGTLSLEKELVKKTSWEDIEIGDVVIYGGSPGHCVIVVDMCQNKKTGEKRFLIAQSWMPAQDIHILRNMDNLEISPWYSNRFEGNFESAECTFYKEHLRTWNEE